jgi:hypothetical protein
VERETGRRLTKTGKGAKYGIPDSSCRRRNDGTLRADHRWLPETARMVNSQQQMRNFRQIVLCLVLLIGLITLSRAINEMSR